MSNPASSRGSTFNGGTITQPLVIATTDGNTIPLSIQAGWNAQNQDFFQVVNTDTGTRMLAVDVSGNTIAFRHTSEAERNLTTNGNAVEGGLPGIQAVGATGARSIGFYDHLPAAQQVVTPATVTPEQLALALQANGALG